MYIMNFEGNLMFWLLTYKSSTLVQGHITRTKNCLGTNNLQWNLCIMDTLGPTKDVQIIKVS